MQPVLVRVPMEFLQNNPIKNRHFIQVPENPALRFNISPEFGRMIVHWWGFTDTIIPGWRNGYWEKLAYRYPL